MSFFHDKTPRQKHLMAVSITGGIAFVLVVVMIWWYLRPQEQQPKDAANQIGDFYTTILDSAQSYFGNKSDTIK